MLSRRLPSSLHMEMVVSHVRKQIIVLQNVLETIGRTHSYEEDYINESLKTVESELRRLRRMIDA